jgi:hypothetical protein
MTAVLTRTVTDSADVTDVAAMRPQPTTVSNPPAAAAAPKTRPSLPSWSEIEEMRGQVLSLVTVDVLELRACWVQKAIATTVTAASPYGQLKQLHDAIKTVVEVLTNHCYIEKNSQLNRELEERRQRLAEELGSFGISRLSPNLKRIVCKVITLDQRSGHDELARQLNVIEGIIDRTFESTASRGSTSTTQSRKAAQLARKRARTASQAFDAAANKNKNKNKNK